MPMFFSVSPRQRTSHHVELQYPIAGATLEVVVVVVVVHQSKRINNQPAFLFCLSGGVSRSSHVDKRNSQRPPYCPNLDPICPFCFFFVYRTDIFSLFLLNNKEDERERERERETQEKQSDSFNIRFTFSRTSSFLLCVGFI